MSETIQLKTTGLDQLMKAFKGKLPVVRIGILGSKNVRSGKKFDASTNASIGALHEYGSSKMPIRSFLRVPLTDNLNKSLEASDAFDKDALSEVVKTGDIRPWLKKVSVLAEGIVAGAFETGGYGKWPKWKSPYYHNDSNMILVDSGQLRDSISSDIK